MAQNFFQLFPKIQYDVDGDGSEKIAIDILRRVKLRAEAALDGAVFYNYQMQAGDTAEIIADKYYGASKYHWVVMMMNNITNPTYDLTLSDVNFENYLAEKYGSLERSTGVTKSLSSIVADGGTANVAAEWRAGTSTALNDSTIRSGTIPSGNSTGFYIRSTKGLNPWGLNIDIGDSINLFVPESWYSPEASEYQKLPYAAPAKIIAISERVDPTASLTHSHFYINTDMNSNTYPTFTWEDGTEDVSVTTGIHHFERDIYNAAATLKLADSVSITQDIYVNTSIGTASTKRIVSNYDYEYKENEDRRVIYLLRKAYLSEFVEEFKTLIKIGTF